MKNFAHYNSRHRKSNLSPDRPGNLEINVPWTITAFFCLIINTRICHGEIRAKILRKQVWGSDVRHRRWAHALHTLQGLKTNTFRSCLYWSSVVKVTLCKKGQTWESLRDNCTDFMFSFSILLVSFFPCREFRFSFEWPQTFQTLVLSFLFVPCCVLQSVSSLSCVSNLLS